MVQNFLATYFPFPEATPVASLFYTLSEIFYAFFFILCLRVDMCVYQILCVSICIYVCVHMCGHKRYKHVLQFSF